ncbi:MAG: polyprenyl synthetase family protein, partial [Ostreibacterium sp.]
NVNNINLTEADYFQVIHLKTAVLFSAACQFSTVIANREDLSDSCKNYGKHLGIAFQIADDVLDYVGNINQIGKNIGDDLAERKITLPLIHAMNNANDSDRNKLRTIIEKGDRKAIADVISILNRTNSIHYSQQVAYHHADLAKVALDDFTDSQYKTVLTHLPDLAVKRTS